MEYTVVLAFFWLLCGIAAAMIGSQKGEGFLAFIIGVIFGPFGILFAHLSSGQSKDAPALHGEDPPRRVSVSEVPARANAVSWPIVVDVVGDLILAGGGVFVVRYFPVLERLCRVLNVQPGDLFELDASSPPAREK